MINSVKVGHIHYEVRQETGLAAAAGVNGACGCDMQQILIDDQLGADQEKETVLHEVLHAIIHAAGIKAWLEEVEKDAGLKELEEKIVATMSGMTLQVVQENPELIAYLRGDGGEV